MSKTARRLVINNPGKTQFRMKWRYVDDDIDSLKSILEMERTTPRIYISSIRENTRRNFVFPETGRRSRRQMTGQS